MGSKGSRAATLVVALTVAVAAAGIGIGATDASGRRAQSASIPGPATATPIKHLVVIFQENVSFDHYFGIYPNATNPAGEPPFNAAPGTPSVNGLTPALLTQNPNSANPARLDRSEALTCDQHHGYKQEQLAFDNGLMDKFVENLGVASCSAPYVGKPGLVMDYYDGNTVTGLWNYAQHFSMSDNFFGSTFGPSTPGALNLVSGQTHGATAAAAQVAQGSVIGDPDPIYDDCSGPVKVSMSGKSIGDLLNMKGITWGFFEGGFRPTSTSGGKAVCGSSHKNIGNANIVDYSAHHEPFQYYASTANPHHLPPQSVGMIGKVDRTHHQYDLSDFWAAVNAGNVPSVSFLKAARYQDGHPGSSDPLDEQQFIVDTINKLEQTPTWSSTAVVIAYDDSDGWYDHVMVSPIVNPSSDATYDALTGPGTCGTPVAGAYQDRCGYGPRLPLVVVSPYARVNFVDHTLTDQSSITKFIETNWGTSQIGDQSFDARAGTLNNLFDFNQAPAPTLTLDPVTGEPAVQR